MTPRGPFQPRTFCDSVKVPLAFATVEMPSALPHGNSTREMFHALVFGILLLVLSWFWFFFFIMERCLHKKGGFVALKKLPCSKNGCRSSFAGVPRLFSLAVSRGTCSAKTFPCQHHAPGPGPAAFLPGGSRFAPPLSAGEGDAAGMPGCCVSPVVGTERVFHWQIPGNLLQDICIY